MLHFDTWYSKYTSLGFLIILISSLLFLYKFSTESAVSRLNKWGWAFLFAGLLLFMRLPIIAYNRELETDESQMIAQAMSLTKYWAYWKDVDGLTQGPLVSYLLLIPSWLYLPFDYTSARLVGYVLLCITLFATYQTFKNLFTTPICLAVFMPVALFYLLNEGRFCVLYNEYAVLCFLAISFWLFSLVYRQSNPTVTILLALGIVSGLIPFAKLQGVPTSLVTLAFTALIILMKSPKKLKMFFVLFAGYLVMPIFMLFFSILTGSFEYFLRFYLVGNFAYSSNDTLWQKILNYPGFLGNSDQFPNLLICYGLLFLSAFPFFVRSKFRTKTHKMLIWFGLFHVLAGFYEVIKSGYWFYHYQQFLIIPLGLLSGAVWDGVYRAKSFPVSTARFELIAWFLICFLPYSVNKWIFTYYSPTLYAVRRSDLGNSIPTSPISREILKYSRPGEDLALWGWHPAYYLETKLSQATADNITYRVLTPSLLQKSYERKFLLDLRRHRPCVFVDLINAHSFWFKDSARYGHEQFPPIRAYIQTHYQHVATINNERIYVRNDRNIP